MMKHSNSFIIHVNGMNEELNGINTQKQKNIFIIKTFFTFLTSITTTVISALCFNTIPEFKDYAKSENGKITTIISTTLLFTTTIPILCCCPKMYMKKYTGIILYTLFSLSSAYLFGIMSIYVKTVILLFSILITFSTVITLILYAIITKSDFTENSPYFMVGLISLIVFVGLNLYIQSKTFEITIALLGSVLFSCFIIYDIQLIIGNKHISFNFKKNDYILAAMSLYLDIINFFVYMLRCLVLLDMFDN